MNHVPAWLADNETDTVSEVSFFCFTVPLELIDGCPLSLSPHISGAMDFMATSWGGENGQALDLWLFARLPLVQAP